MLLLHSANYFLRQVSIYSIFLPLLLSLLLFVNLNKIFRILAVLLCVTTIIQLGSTFVKNYYTTIPQKYNLFLFHILIPVESVLLVWMYKIKLRDLIPAKVFTLLMLVFVVFSVTNTIQVMEPFDSVQSLWSNFRYIAKFNNYAQLLEGLLLMGLAFGYFYKLMRELKIESLEKEGFFWFSIGILIYFSSNFTLDIFSNFIKSSSNELKYITWGVHHVATILLHVFYSLAIWYNSQK